MRSYGIRRAVLIVPLLLVGAAGCSNFYPVHGTVTLDDGTPVKSGMVVFESKDSTPIVARGEIQADGSYRLSTQKPGDGVAPGKYRVMITPPPLVDLDQPRPKPAFDARYCAFATSGLEFEVKAETNEIPIKLARPGKSRK